MNYSNLLERSEHGLVAKKSDREFAGNADRVPKLSFIIFTKPKSEAILEPDEIVNEKTQKLHAGASFLVPSLVRLISKHPILPTCHYFVFIAPHCATTRQDPILCLEMSLSFVAIFWRNSFIILSWRMTNEIVTVTESFASRTHRVLCTAQAGAWCGCGEFGPNVNRRFLACAVSFILTNCPQNPKHVRLKKGFVRRRLSRSAREGTRTLPKEITAVEEEFVDETALASLQCDDQRLWKLVQLNGDPIEHAESPYSRIWERARTLEKIRANATGTMSSTSLTSSARPFVSIRRSKAHGASL
jgi:hypothetical protein